MLVVACDMGLSKSGIVLMDSNYNILSQNLVKVKSRGAQRLVDIEHSIDFILSGYSNIQAFIEGYAYGARYQRESLAELGGVMRRYFLVNSIDCWAVPPRTLKSYVTGTGTANKNYMKKCTKERWGLHFKSDDVCDAYGLARLGVSVLRVTNGEDTPLNAKEYDIVNNIVKYRDRFRNGNTASQLGKDKSSNG